MPSGIEREVKFLGINAEIIKTRLIELGAEDKGQHLLSEMIFYFKDSSQPNGRKNGQYVRIRTFDGKTFLTHKKFPAVPSIGVEEIEFQVSDAQEAEAFVEAMGWTATRRQEKRRHKFYLDNISFDIDTWPNVPPYLEIEAETEEAIQKGASMIGLSWKNRNLKNAASVLKEYYGIDIWSLEKFTFTEIK